MANESYILSVDIGTTTIRSVLYNSKCEKMTSYQEKVNIIYTTGEENEVLAEIDPDTLFQQFLSVIKQAYCKVAPGASVALAICTQRNSIVLWNRKSKKEESRIICWNDKRASRTCQEFNKSFIVKLLNFGGAFLHTLTRKNRFFAAQQLKFLDAMVSHRLMVTISRSKRIAQLKKEGNLSFGCLETWLLMRCSSQNMHSVEASNISTSGMFDPWIGDYNYSILRIVGFPTDLLSPVVDSNLSEMSSEPYLDSSHLGAKLNISSILADQQAAMYGCGMWEKGDVKITLGTGTFVDIHTGNAPYASMSGLYPIVGWRINGATDFMAEGNAHDTAVVLHWAQSIGLFDDVTKTSEIAKSVGHSNGTVFVPAFRGIQTPINDEGACSGFLALKPDTCKDHMVRAILESISFRVYQIYSAAKDEVYINKNRPIRICGGVSNNDFICQCIADLLNRKVERMKDSDHVAAKGIAMFAGYTQGMWSQEELKNFISVDDVFTPDPSSRKSLLKTFSIWSTAVNHCLGFYK